MASRKHEPTVREVVGIFHNPESLRCAIEELLMSGFQYDELGLLASEHVVEKSLGDLYVRTNEAADSPDAPAIAFVRRESLGDATRMRGLAGTTGVGRSQAPQGRPAGSA